MRRAKLALGLVTVGALLTACSGSGDGEEQGTGSAQDGGGGAEQQAEASQEPPSIQLSVPSLYDTSRGWESDLEGTQIPLPRSGAVAVYSEQEDGYRFTVMDAATGEKQWSSVLLQPLGNTNLPYLVSAVGGKEYLVAWSSGTTDADAINVGREVVSIDIFPVVLDEVPSGSGVEPVHVEVEGEGDVHGLGTGLVVEDDGDTVVAVDPATGDTTEYQLDELAPPAGCPDCDADRQVVALTENGPLLTTVTRGIDDSGYWVPDGWSAEDLRPDNADPDEEPVVSAVTDNLLLTGWDEAGETDGFLWHVVDSASGQTLASIRCEGEQVTTGAGSRLSANGRYLTNGPRVFDLETGSGVCYERTETTHQLRFEIVTDEGMAYGYSWTDDPVQLDMRSGELAEIEDPTIDFPFGDTAGYGLFWDGVSETMVAYPHA